MKSVLLKRVRNGRVHRGRVLDVSVVQRYGIATRLMVVDDLTSGEGHVLLGNHCCDPQARVGDEGTLTFIHSEHAPYGGDWQFRKDP